MAVYLDCNATAPLDPEVRAAMLNYFDVDYGNAGSRTHEYGQTAKRAVEDARRAVAEVVDAQARDVHFTSGATESNNLAILGLAAYGEAMGQRHIISTAIEHKAVLEPLEQLAKRGFEITLLPSGPTGRVEPGDVRRALRPDTCLISVMHVNNETGIIQPLSEIIEVVSDHPAYLHVDAAQGFGKELSMLRSARIDFISISAHKIYGPKGVGALVARRRGTRRPPLTPLMFGGGQEQGVRPGTLPVPQIAGLGAAASLALRDAAVRHARNSQIRKNALEAFSRLGAQVNGDSTHSLPSTLNISIPGVDAEAAMVALRDVAAVSNGSACTSSSYTPSHVLVAMQLSEERINGALRFSWCHLTEPIDWQTIAESLEKLA